MPDLSRPFTIHTDASIYALGAILTQHDDDGNEYVVAYASRALKAGELNFGVTAKEGLPVWWACKQFFPFIDGVEFPPIADGEKKRYNHSTYVSYLKRTIKENFDFKKINDLRVSIFTR